VIEPELLAQTGVWLSSPELTVEAGGYVELRAGVDGQRAPNTALDESYTVALRGLDRGWFTWSTRRLTGTVGEGKTALVVFHPPRGPRLTGTGEFEFVVSVTPASGGRELQASGRLTVLPPVTVSDNRLLHYLPAIYSSDDFTRRFLALFQGLLDPMEDLVDSTELYVDPDLAPPSLLPWLATWVGLTFNAGMHDAQRRALIRQAVDIARWRGTRHGMQAELETRLGGKALIVENFRGLRLGQDAALGLNTRLGERADGRIAVTFAARPGAVVDAVALEAQVAELKPAFAGHTVQLTGWPSTRGGHG